MVIRAVGAMIVRQAVRIRERGDALRGHSRQLRRGHRSARVANLEMLSVRHFCELC
jgi:hypothetical protein